MMAFLDYVERNIIQTKNGLAAILVELGFTEIVLTFLKKIGNIFLFQTIFSCVHFVDKCTVGFILSRDQNRKILIYRIWFMFCT